MDILGENIDAIEQLLLDSVATALLRIALDWVELVEAIDLNTLKRHLACLVASHQLAIDAQRSAARRKAENEVTIRL